MLESRPAVISCLDVLLTTCLLLVTRGLLPCAVVLWQGRTFPELDTEMRNARCLHMPLSIVRCTRAVSGTLHVLKFRLSETLGLSEILNSSPVLSHIRVLSDYWRPYTQAISNVLKCSQAFSTALRYFHILEQSQVLTATLITACFARHHKDY